MISQITFKNVSQTRMTTTKQYDTLNRLTSIATTNAAGSAVTRHAYQYNDGNQRVAITNVDGSRWVYQYDSLGQVTSGKRYFWAELGADNASGAVWLGVTNLALLAGGRADQSDLWRTNTGHLLLPHSPEGFTHDADGNLTADGRWTYTWNGENRLIALETASGAVAAGKLAQRLDFAYDPQGRRIQKKVYAWDTDHWSLTADTRFLYDGWNLLATFDALNSQPPTLNRSFTWGLDLSGSEQGAGGVGGLLAISAPSTINSQPSTHFVAYDGNGNVMAMVDAGTGLTTAQYEYGPFGELLRATGPMAQANPFRFSTKYQDDETDLLYYGYRFLDVALGRWVSRDPLLEYGGPNHFAFANNCAPQYYDHLGLLIYTINDLKQELHNRKANRVGDMVLFAIKELEKRKHKIAVKNMWFSHYDGGKRYAYVDCDADSLKAATDWLIDALREWAGGGAGFFADDYFYEISREWARNGVSKPNDAAVVAGETLDWLYLFSEDASPNSIAPEYEWKTHFGTDAASIFSWIFTGKKQYPLNYNSVFAIPSSPGLDEDYWDTSQVRPNGDVTHIMHFAGFLYYGWDSMSGTGAWGDIFLKEHLVLTGDYPKQANTAGDFNLGVVGWDVAQWLNHNPGFHGAFVTQIVKSKYDTAKQLLGRQNDP